MEDYRARYKDYLERAGINQTNLPSDLQELIQKFEKAHESLAQVKGNEKHKLYSIIAKVDAAIAADIYSLFKENIEGEELNKAKILAMKAKALKLKWNIQNN